MSGRQTTHFYGDGCIPEHRAAEACKQFVSASHIHAHDLGRVPCVNCGWRYQEHPGNAPQSDEGDQ